MVEAMHRPGHQNSSRWVRGRPLRRVVIASAVVVALFGGMRTDAFAPDAPAVRIEDVTQVAGEHPNQLVGFGLVTGLAGTGGSSPSTKLFAMTLLQNLGQRADPVLREQIERSQEKTNNLSVVIVNATLPPHAKIGQRIDVTVAAFDDAQSLQGGILSYSDLTGVDGEVYVTAAGPISINGGNFGGQAANVVKNHPTAGRIPGGGVVEAEVPSGIFRDGVFRLLLNQPHYQTARRIAEAINQVHPACSVVLDPATVIVRVPPNAAHNPHGFVADCQQLNIIPDAVARVVINERTGTIVFGEHVRLSRVAITHGNLIVSTIENPEVSQPAPLSEGETVVVPRTDVLTQEQESVINVIDQTTTVRDLAASLNSLGVTPRDLSSIFQMLKESGALHAELELK